MKGGRITDALKPIAELHAKVDEWLTRIPPDMKVQIPCEYGCWYCCQQMIMVTVPEAMYLIAELLQSEKGLHRLQRMAPQIEVQARESVQPGMSNTKWFQQERRCVFLDDTKDWRHRVCHIYERRPVACRAYYVMGCEPVTCTLPLLKVKCLDTKPIHELELQAAERVGRDLRINPTPMPLPVSLHWAITGYFRGLGELRQRQKRGQHVRMKVEDDGVVSA